MQYFKLFHYYYICYGDLWSVIFDVATITHWRFRWWLAYFSNKNIFKSRYVYCFFRQKCYFTLNRLQYSTNITFICVTRFIAILSLLQWSGTALAISPRYACIHSYILYYIIRYIIFFSSTNVWKTGTVLKLYSTDKIPDGKSVALPFS